MAALLGARLDDDPEDDVNDTDPNNQHRAAALLRAWAARA
jgi:hypothetical protein